MRDDCGSAANALAIALVTSLVVACGAEPDAQPAAPEAQPASGSATTAAASVTGPSPATPQRVTALPAPVAALVAELAMLCRDAGGAPRTEDAVRRADLNGDGREDFVLYAGWAQCENAWSIYGDREKVVNVFVADASGGATPGFADMVFDANIEITNGRAVLWVDTMGSECGRPPAATFAEESFCSRALVPKGTSELEYAPVATVRMIE